MLTVLNVRWGCFRHTVIFGYSVIIIVIAVDSDFTVAVVTAVAVFTVVTVVVDTVYCAYVHCFIIYAGYVGCVNRVPGCLFDQGCQTSVLVRLEARSEGVFTSHLQVRRFQKSARGGGPYIKFIPT